MSKKYCALFLSAIALASCAKEQFADESELSPDVAGREFIAVTPSAKTGLDGNKVYWVQNDELSVFDKTNGNLEYKFEGETGDDSGKFIYVSGEAGATELNYVYALYPYSASAVAAEGALSAEWPATQAYSADSFAPGANVMTAVSENTELLFKNAGGVLSFKFYSSSVFKVKKLVLAGNSGEAIAGAASIAVGLNSDPVVTMDEDAETAVTIDCGDGVTLGATAQEATVFNVCLPPVTFSNGFTITLYDEDSCKSFTKKTSRSIEISRNTVVTMTAVAAKAGYELKRGSGTEDDPYLIGSVDEMMCVSGLTNDEATREEYLTKCYKMDADIDMNEIENFVPIARGGQSYPFSGTFDGDGCKITNLHVSANGSGAGLFGFLNGGTIKKVNIASATMSNTNVIGGIVGRVDGDDSVIQDCIFQGSINSSSYYVGGIAGVMTAGKVTGCVLGSKGDVKSTSYYVGGIAGGLVSNKSKKDYSTISNCACYGSVTGKYAVGGIVGLLSATTGFATARISTCCAKNVSIIATGYDDSNRALVGGIAGKTTENGKVQIDNSYSIPAILKDTDTNTSIGCVGGIVGGNYCTGTSKMLYCYSNVTKESIRKGSVALSESTKTCYNGAAFGRTYKTGTCTAGYCYYMSGMDLYSASYCTASNCVALSASSFTNGTLLSKLQATPSTKAGDWKADTDGYPTFGSIPADPTPGSQTTKKKVSVIGDSISTWSGWIPAQDSKKTYSYKYHYPVSSGTEPPTSVTQAYWYRVIYTHMKNAEFEKNIAYSGTDLTETSQATFDAWHASHPDSKTDWFKKDFIRRYYDQGLGDPDVVIIHGGTNDWNHNCVKLVGNEKIRRTTAPVKADMDAAFARADAATTAAQAKALDGGTFVDSYCKLIRMIVIKNPKVKIVCIAPSYSGIGMEQAILQIAEHYKANCRCVDLFAVNGFQDLGIWDYPESPLPTNPKQPHFPTHDFNPSNGHGAHPNITGMKNIAKKIYDECGEWLNE